MASLSSTEELELELFCLYLADRTKALKVIPVSRIQDGRMPGTRFQKVWDVLGTSVRGLRFAI